MRIVSRRQILTTGCSLGAGGLFLPPGLLWAAPPNRDPAAHLGLAWTANLKWANVIDITRTGNAGKYWDDRLLKVQDELSGKGGGVVFFPAGVYHFEKHIRLKSGIIIRGEDPMGAKTAHDDNYSPPTKFEFPEYKPKLSGEGTPIDTAFKGIHLDDPIRASHCGVVNVSINRGHIRFEEDADHRCGGNRIVFGCLLRNCAVADPAVPKAAIGQKPWQRFTSRHHAAIDVKGSENILVANNRLAKSGDDNFTMKDFILKPNRGSADRYDVVFDYDNRPGMYVSEYCIGGAGGSGNDGTPETHPWGFRKGIVICDNYLFQTGRTPIAFTGDGTICRNNVIRIPKDIWRPTTTGQSATSGSSTNDNRAIQMRGWRWTVEDNDFEVHRNWAAQRRYLINDGEGLMHEDHCNSDLRGSRLTGNRGNSYLSIYKCGSIDGLHIEGNDISVPSNIADIYVVSDRNSGPAPIRNVSIINNRTRSNGILVQGSPSKNVTVKNNEHIGGGGSLHNKANATCSGNKGYA